MCTSDIFQFSSKLSITGTPEAIQSEQLPELALLRMRGFGLRRGAGFGAGRSHVFCKHDEVDMLLLNVDFGI